MSSAIVRLLTALGALFLFHGAVAAQPALPRVDETLEVSIVNVDVVVTDRKGNRVRGLTSEDLEVLENGIAQPITNFTEYAPEPVARSRSRAGVAQASAEVPRERRTVVIFVESFVVAPFHARPLFEQLRETVRRVVRPGDAAAVVTWANALVVRQDFTDDVAALEAALTAIEKESAGVPGNPGMTLRTQEALEEMFEGSLAEEGFRTMRSDNLRAGAAVDAALFQLFKIRQKTFALNSVMQRISGFEGKKIVLMAMHRFGEHAGAEYFGGNVPGEYRPLLETSRYRNSLTSTANANNITLYTLYPAGLGTARMIGADVNPRRPRGANQGDLARASYDHNVLGNEIRSLDELARDTGGLMQWSSKEIVALLPRIAEDLESYYSLGYRATASRAGAQKILVRAKNRDYIVRSRREYMHKSDEAEMHDRVIAGLYQPVDSSRIPLEVEIGRLEQTGARRWTAPLRVRVPVSALTVIDTPEGPSGQFTVYVAPGAVFGLTTDVQSRTLPFTADADQVSRPDASFITCEFTLHLDDITDRVSVGVFDQVSKEFGVAKVAVPERKLQ